MITILEALRELSLLEESAKTDFIAQFGEDVFVKFNAAKDLLKKKGHSVDYGQYLKKDRDKVLALIASVYDKDKDAQKIRMVLGTDKEIRGEYNYLGEKGGYKVYQPLDVKASMDLGVNTGWCTTGRYGHYGHPEFTPSYPDAEKHWKDYTNNGVKFYYFLNPETMYGEYAIALYPEILDIYDECGDYFVKESNIEIFNAKDDLDFSSLSELPVDLIPEEIICDYEDLEAIEIEDDVLIKYRGKDKEFVIPARVTTIGYSAFSGCPNLTTVTFEKNSQLTSIGSEAFKSCYKLKSITIPASVTSIGSSAFYDCDSLTTVTFEGNSQLTSISNYVFKGCTSITSVTIPAGVTRIGSDAFSGCSNLTTVNYLGTLEQWLNISFGYYANPCSYGAQLYINGTLLTKLVIPDTITEIQDCAFNGCVSITSVTIPASVTSIGRYAFEYCSRLTSITIPASVTSIGDEAFGSCGALETIYYKGTISSWDKIKIRNPLISYNIEFKCSDQDPDDGKIVLLSDGNLLSDADGDILTSF